MPYHDGATPDATTGDDVTDEYLAHVAAAKGAIDAVEECPVARSAILIEPKTDYLTVPRFNRTRGVHTPPSFQGESAWGAGSLDE